jgi:AraC-like DNA-binding protein
VLDDPVDGGLRGAAETLVDQAREEDGVDNEQGPQGYFARQAAFYHWLEVYAQALRAAGVSFRVVGETDPRLVQARQWLDAAGLDRRISRQELAVRVGWSLPQLTRRFSAEYGMTPREYFKQRRFTRARLELMRGRWRIKQIAAELGCIDLAQFSNWFSRHANQAPRHFRGRGNP